ncbi:hypothetical protein BT93_L1396 [Corymbia citriodora subsp. variegata]|uniref:Uncharacterized protein n=1 Tax=Corymbia citriodora subsp. variegata TaxID=360336 RepID=A0A8T0CMW2_CORYI|nr:hypothetical protein BT93_L1396 [Corymbia citriodora subsp. variegata]
MYLWRPLLWLLFITTIESAKAGRRFYNWEVRRELRSRDHYKIVTINGKSPGPTIQVNLADHVFVKVTNRMGEIVSIHWDGVRQIESLGFDGIEGVARGPIRPGKAFIYHLIADRLGKSQYYSSYIKQKNDGLRGLIEILPAETVTYDYDMSIVLDDRYYRSNYSFAADSELLLIPRKGKLDCAELTTPSSHPTACYPNNFEYSHWKVVPGKTYRLKISSLTAKSTLCFQIECHNLTVVEAYGHYVEPVQNLLVDSGRTYSVLVKANQNPLRNYLIMTNIVGQNNTATSPLGLAVLSYSSSAGPIRNHVTPQLVQSVGSKAGPAYHMMLAFLLMLAWLIRRLSKC